MTLRRFPWKVPRTTDNSFRLFILPPDPGTPGDPASRRTSETRPKSIIENSSGGEKSTGDDTKSHHHKDKDEGKSVAPPKSADGTKSEVIKGPWRLLRLLPRESRHIIGRMLELDPKKRATLDEILDDKWIKNSQVCAQEEGGTIIRAENHEHTLEPGAGSGSAPATKQK